MATLLTSLGPTASVAAGCLVAVFATAAVAKMRRPASAELHRLGLPAPRLLAAALPAVELAVVALLIARPRIGAAAAVVLLAAFTRVLARAVAEGQELSCGCFGSAAGRTVSWATVARNGVLLSLGALAVAGSGWTAPDAAAVAVVAGVVTVGAISVQLFDLWLSMGRLWSVNLAGEARQPSTRRNAT